MQATGQGEIKSGIVRDYPTTYRDRLGNTVTVGFTVEEVLRDGRPEPYHTESPANGVQIYIGQKDVFLKAGIYTYTIRYRVDRELGFFKDFDELYWNVTGNGCPFAIDRADAHIELPAGAKILSSTAYTGSQGEKGHDFTVQAGDHDIVFKTTRRLAPKEGLTVAVSWLKGVVYDAAKAQQEQQEQRVADLKSGKIKITNIEEVDALNRKAVELYQGGRYHEAQPLWQQALMIREKALGPEHVDTAGSFEALGIFYKDQKDYPVAEAHFRRARSQAGLIDLSLAQGQPEEALRLLQNTAAPTWRNPPGSQVLYHTLHGLALAGVGRFGEASLALHQAVQGVEELRRRVPGEKSGFFQGGFAGSYLRPYRGLVGVLAEMPLKSQALPPDLKENGPGPGGAGREGQGLHGALYQHPD